MRTKLFFIALCLVLSAVLVAGCLGSDDGANNSSDDGANNSSDDVPDNSSLVTAPPDPIETPTDLAMYRGNVTNITTVNNTTTMILAQAAGTNFGASSATFVFDNGSKMNFNFSDVKIGQYIEVYYGAPADNTADLSQTQTVFVANMLQYANMTVYNGEVVSVTPAVDAGSSTYAGKLEVKLENNTTMIFNCDENTQFYMNMSDVAAGARVSIYGNWVVLSSMPPQNTAYEVHAYYSGE